MNWWIPVLVIGYAALAWAAWSLIRVAAWSDQEREELR